VTKLGVWHCLGRLAREKNPRLVAIIEIEDAKQLLQMREALEALATGNIGKAKIATAKRLLAKQ
jgi:hypothetical protein